MTFKCRFNATCFLFKINRFVLIFSKTSNRFVLKICSGGFADYTLQTGVIQYDLFFLPGVFLWSMHCAFAAPVKYPDRDINRTRWKYIFSFYGLWTP